MIFVPIGLSTVFFANTLYSPRHPEDTGCSFRHVNLEVSPKMLALWKPLETRFYVKVENSSFLLNGHTFLGKNHIFRQKNVWGLLVILHFVAANLPAMDQ
jgi:hypothetical protein